MPAVSNPNAAHRNLIADHDEFESVSDSLLFPNGCSRSLKKMIQRKWEKHARSRYGAAASAGIDGTCSATTSSVHVTPPPSGSDQDPAPKTITMRSSSMPRNRSVLSKMATKVKCSTVRFRRFSGLGAAMLRSAAAGRGPATETEARGDECLLAALIPLEIRMLIFAFLTAAEVDRGVGLTCKALRNETESSVPLWEELCVRTGKMSMPWNAGIAQHLRRAHAAGGTVNPYLAHYHRLPCVPDDFPSVDAAISAVLTSGGGKRRRRRRFQAKDAAERTRACRVKYARGEYVSLEDAMVLWNEERTKVEALLNMRARVLRLSDEDLWIHCRM